MKVWKSDYHEDKMFNQMWGAIIDILYTLDSASIYSAIQKLKPWLQSQVVPIKWEDLYVLYFLNRELKH